MTPTPLSPPEAIVPPHKRPTKKKASAKAPNACPSCGGRLRIHWEKAECVVPGCGWTGKLG